MAYSIDPDENKNNAHSPSSMSITEQLLYRIAALDASVQSGFRRIDEKMDRFQSDLHDSQIATNDRINALDSEFNAAILRKRMRIEGLEKKLNDIEVWQKIQTARIALAGGLFVMAWTFVAPFVRHAVGMGS